MEGAKCMLKKGRKKGEKVEIVKIEGAFAVVKGGKKERRVALRHLDYV